MMTRLTLTCLYLAIAVSPAAALDLGQIPDTNRWVLHVDTQRAMSGALGDWYAKLRRNPTADARLQLLENLSGVTFANDIHSITLTGIDNREDQVAVIIHGQFQPERLTTLARAANAYQALAHNAHQVHHWKDDGKNHYAAIVGTNTLIVAGYQAPVQRILDTIDQGAGSLATDPSFADMANATATIVAGVADGVDQWQGLRPRARLLQEVDRIRVTIDEAGDAMVLNLTVTAKQLEKAEQMQQVVQGLIALYGLGHDQIDDQNVVRLLRSLAVKRDGATVTITTTYPTGILLQALANKIGVTIE